MEAKNNQTALKEENFIVANNLGDSRKNIVRINSKYLKKLGIKSGDFIDIGKNRKLTIAKAHPLDDVGINIIRMGKAVRRKLNTEIRDVIKIKKAKSNGKLKLLIGPAKKAEAIKSKKIYQKVSDRVSKKYGKLPNSVKKELSKIKKLGIKEFTVMYHPRKTLRGKSKYKFVYKI